MAEIRVIPEKDDRYGHRWVHATQLLAERPDPDPDDEYVEVVAIPHTPTIERDGYALAAAGGPPRPRVADTAVRDAAREVAHVAYHDHNIRCGCRNVGHLTAFIADAALAVVVEEDPTITYTRTAPLPNQLAERLAEVERALVETPTSTEHALSLVRGLREDV